MEEAGIGPAPLLAAAPAAVTAAADHQQGAAGATVGAQAGVHPPGAALPDLSADHLPGKLSKLQHNS